MDQESLKKEQTLLKIRDEAHAWLDKERQASQFIQFHENNIVRLRERLESDAFIGDHNGYLLALGQLRAHKIALDAIKTAPERAGKAIKELEELRELADA